MPQRVYIPKEEAALPTVLTGSTFVTAMVAANERRKVRCYDIPHAFVNTDVNRDIIMGLKGEVSELMIQIAPEVYRRYVTADKNVTKVL